MIHRCMLLCSFSLAGGGGFKTGALPEYSLAQFCTYLVKIVLAQY